MLTTVHGAQPALQLAVKRVLRISDDEVEIQAHAASGWTQNWVFWADGVFSAVHRVFDDDLTRVSMSLNPTWASHLIYAFPLGCWEDIPGDASLDLVRNIVEAYLSIAIDAEWDAPIHVRQAYDDDDQLTAWTLMGLERFTNSNRVDGIPTQARLEIVLATSGGVHTLTLYAGNQAVASGSRTGDGAIAITELNDSGISGSVTLTYTNDLAEADAAYVVASWPLEYTLAEGDDTLKVLQDNGYGNRFAAHIDADADGDPLASGTHSIKLKFKSDTNVESAFGTPVDITLGYRTPSPSDPSYLDGDCTNTRIQFTAATPAWTVATAYAVRQWVTPSTGPAGYAYECTVAGTSHATVEPTWPTTLGQTVTDGTVTWTCRPAVTYRVYDSELDGQVKYEATPTTAAASGGTVTVTLPAIAAAAGVRRPHIAAVCNGIEDLSGLTLDIEYAVSGAVVEPGPNAPVVKISSISGRSLTLAYEYDAGWDDVTPATVKGWLVAEGATPDWGTPDVSQAVASVDGFSRRSGTVELTAGADGHFQWILRIADADGNLSENTDLIGPRWLGTGVPTVPTLELSASA